MKQTNDKENVEHSRSDDSTDTHITESYKEKNKSINLMYKLTTRRRKLCKFNIRMVTK